SATPTSPPGTYPVVATLSDPDQRLGNYTVTMNTGTLTVTAPEVIPVPPTPAPASQPVVIPTAVPISPEVAEAIALTRQGPIPFELPAVGRPSTGMSVTPGPPLAADGRHAGQFLAGGGVAESASSGEGALPPTLSEGGRETVLPMQPGGDTSLGAAFVPG